MGVQYSFFQPAGIESPTAAPTKRKGKVIPLPDFTRSKQRSEFEKLLHRELRAEPATESDATRFLRKFWN